MQIKRDHRGRDSTPDADEGSDSNSELSPLKKWRYRGAVAVAHLLLGRVRALIAIYAAVTAGNFLCLLRRLLNSSSMVQGTSKRPFPGCENMWWKNCVCLPEVGNKTQLSHLISHNPGRTF